ncbi:MAG: FAD-dependent oxidoreductase, partial [Dehalococcoidia bacterium]|nr:FAD-dependent oxidoreductase [Dehalococcoidia bacterium]
GVELNAAEGFLIAEFLSPLTNHRDDAYGGSVEARRLFLTQLISAVRERIGAEPLLGVRIGTDSYLEDGLTADDIGPLATAIGATGAVDYLSTTPLHLPHMGQQPGAFSELANAARGAGLPVIYFGWVDGPETAESLLETGICDLVGMSRATLADLDLPKKARAGETETIRPCIACNQTCLTLGSLCLLNPRLSGMEPGMNGAGTAEARKVLIVGGGPAGIEAACLLASRGHGVTLWERDDELGGQLRVAARAPHRERIANLADYYERELDRCGVTVELERSATVDDVRAFGPDAVVVATGAFGHIPDTLGVDQPHVTDVRSILRGFVEPGEHTVVVLGRAEHRFQGLTVAEFIAARGKSVHIVTDAFFAGDLWDEPTRLDTMRRLNEFGAEFSTMSELVQISEHDIEIRNRYSLEPTTLEADTVVLAYGDDADSNLLAELEAGELAVYSIGDVVAPRDLQGAVRDANLLASTL